MDPITFSGGITANIATNILLHFAPVLENTLAGRALRCLGLLPSKIDGLLRDTLVKALARLVQEHPDYDLSGIEAFFSGPDVAQQLGNYILDGKPVDEGQVQRLFTQYLADEHLTRIMINLRGQDPLQIVRDFLGCYRTVLRQQSNDPQMALLLAITEQTSTVLTAVQGSEERIISAIQALAGQLTALAPSPLEEARQKLDKARKRMEDADYEAAAHLYEEAADLAAKAQNVEYERGARVSATSAWDSHIVRSRLTDHESRYALSQIERQIQALELLDMNPAELALERSRLAVLNRDGVNALRWADQALDDAEEGSKTWIAALVTCLQAHWQLEQTEQALELADLVVRASSASVEGDPRLVVAAMWLRTLSKAGKATQDDVAVFCGLVRDLVADPTVGPKRAMLLVGDVAAEFNRGGTPDKTLTLLELAYELGEEVGEPAMVISAALQAAEIAVYAGDVSKVNLFLGKASAWVDKSKSAKVPQDEQISLWANLRANWLVTKGRILVTMAERSMTTNLPVEEMLREAFDVFTEARQFILDHRSRLRGDVELFLADLHWWWGGAASQLNWYNKAAELFRAVRSDTAMAHPHFSADIGMRAWLREAESLALAGRLDKASSVLDALLADSKARGSAQPRAERFRGYLDTTIRPTVEWFGTPEAQAIMQLSKRKSLREAIAEQMAPLVAWWVEWRSDSPRPESELLDFWGRGGFSRVVAAIRAKPHGVIAVDAWSAGDIRRWARILCPLFETVIVKWKGELGEGMVMTPIPKDYGGPGSFGGHGYEITSSTVRENWAIAMTWANPLPSQIAAFLAIEALPLIQSGRLVVLPASLVGCTQSAVGWTDNLLVDGFLGGVVNIARKPPGAIREYIGRQRVLDLSTISIPYIEDISLSDLTQVLEETEEWVPRLRSLLLKSILSDDLRYERWESISILEHEIQDACRELHVQLERLTPVGKWHVTDVEGSLSAASHGASVPAHEPVTNLLRSIASTQHELAPWIPYWRMNSLGGRLDWSCPIDNPSKPPEQPAIPQDLHSWLYPGTGGWGIHTVIVFPSDI